MMATLRNSNFRLSCQLQGPKGPNQDVAGLVCSGFIRHAPLPSPPRRSGSEEALVGGGRVVGGAVGGDQHPTAHLRMGRLAIRLTRMIPQFIRILRGEYEKLL